MTSKPFDKLNVLTVQNAAAYRYHTRCGNRATSPRPDRRYCDAPATFVLVCKRMTEPPAQRSPSPNTAPAPPPTCVVPWKYKAELSGIPVPASTSVSLAMLGTPLDAMFAPLALTELAQPLPARPLFAHGQAVPLPSPEQNPRPVP